MRVTRLHTVLVIDENHEAVSTVIPTGLLNDPGFRGIDRICVVSIDVDAGMFPPVVLVDDV